MDNIYISTIKRIVNRFPAVIPHLKGRARWVAYAIAHSKESFDNPIYTEIRRFKSLFALQDYMNNIDDSNYKTLDYMLRQIEGLVQGVYDGNVGGEFIDVMANLISGQLTQAYEQAWADEGGEGELPEYLINSVEKLILEQYDFVDGYYRDIVDAVVDETPIDPLLARAQLWANQWQSAYEEAVHLITLNSGGKEEWVLGETEEHCETCSKLNGIVAFASEWEESGVYPQGAPNEKLDCGGWRCDCSRQPTDKRRTRGAFDKIQSIVG